MAHAKLRMNSYGHDSLDYHMRKPQTVALLGRVAEAIRASAGASGPGHGYTASVTQGRTRARATVAAYSIYARRDNAEDNSILKGIAAGRAVL